MTTTLEERKARASQWFAALRDRICAAFEALEDELEGANAERFTKLIVEQAKAERFEKQLAAFQQSPQVYRIRQYLSAFQQATEKIRKYVVASRSAERIILIVDDKENIPTGLLGLGEEITEQIKEGQQ